MTPLERVPYPDPSTEPHPSRLSHWLYREAIARGLGVQHEAADRLIFYRWLVRSGRLQP